MVELALNFFFSIFQIELYVYYKLYMYIIPAIQNLFVIHYLEVFWAAETKYVETNFSTFENSKQWISFIISRPGS